MEYVKNNESIKYASCWFLYVNVFIEEFMGILYHSFVFIVIYVVNASRIHSIEKAYILWSKTDYTETASHPITETW